MVIKLRHMLLLKLLVTILVVFWPLAGLAQSDNGGSNPTKYWPQWRGPLATGVAPNANPPLEWSEEKKYPLKDATAGQRDFNTIVWVNRYRRGRRYSVAAHPAKIPFDNII